MSQGSDDLCHEICSLLLRCEQYGIDKAFRHSRDQLGEVCVSRFKVLLNQFIDITCRQSNILLPQRGLRPDRLSQRVVDLVVPCQSG